MSIMALLSDRYRLAGSEDGLSSVDKLGRRLLAEYNSSSNAVINVAQISGQAMPETDHAQRQACDFQGYWTGASQRRPERASLKWASASFAILAAMVLGMTPSLAAEVVALGASNTYGKGVNRGEDFPSQLEAMLRAKGLNVSVANAGVSGDTTYGMLARFDGVVDPGTRLLILQPGGNDARQGLPESERNSNISAIVAKATAHHIRVVMVPNTMFRGLPHQSDEMHLTPDGYRMLASELLPGVMSALHK
jgi:acyl-CoA thioesterase I